MSISFRCVAFATMPYMLAKHSHFRVHSRSSLRRPPPLTSTPSALHVDLSLDAARVQRHRPARRRAAKGILLGEAQSRKRLSTFTTPSGGVIHLLAFKSNIAIASLLIERNTIVFGRALEQGSTVLPLSEHLANSTLLSD